MKSNSRKRICSVLTIIDTDDVRNGFVQHIPDWLMVVTERTC